MTSEGSSAQSESLSVMLIWSETLTIASFLSIILAYRLNMDLEAMNTKEDAAHGHDLVHVHIHLLIVQEALLIAEAM